ncbi:protein phosphatase 1 regulatory subunit 16A [Notothenia coriiceps]|uniref:Protein phosphatase 1 regulatory subunit 16A n=1 Tax=Notothenia coriiceps TaxID=8208 RepID=A0A6I9P6N2_9TELE|nr:PREDICTED: protein phosphatase 1 regulatory subunit 16A [Notothenia coriiceps]
MAAEHGELLGEMATVGRLGATERLKHAQKRRVQQLKGWAQMEKDSTRGSRAKADKKKARTIKVTFPQSITLLDAAARNDVEEVRELLNNGVSPDLVNEDGLTALHQLHIASANGYVSVAELLVEHRAQMEARDSDGWTPLHAASCWGQIQMVELLVAHGASLNTKSVLDETPLDVCMDEEVRAKLMDLKHKHDAIMKSQDRQKGTLQRRASSTGSRGKVVRRVSVNERSSLYRREHHKEAMVWQERGRQPESQDEDEDRQTDNELHRHATMVAGAGATSRLEELESADRSVVSSLGNGGTSLSPASSVPGEVWSGGGLMDRSASYQLSPSEGEGADSMTREKSHQTLADLKRQRAAAKLNKYPAPQPPLPPALEEEPAAELTPPQAQHEVQTAPPPAEELASPSQVYFTPASGDPPLLKLRAPEEEQSNNKEPCCGLM